MPNKKLIESRQTCDSCPFKPVCWAAAPGHRRCEFGTVFGGDHALDYLLGVTIITLMTAFIFIVFS